MSKSCAQFQQDTKSQWHTLSCEKLRNAAKFSLQQQPSACFVIFVKVIPLKKFQVLRFQVHFLVALGIAAEDKCLVSTKVAATKCLFAIFVLLDQLSCTRSHSSLFYIQNPRSPSTPSDITNPQPHF